MTKTEIVTLKSLINTFCRNEINHNRCDDGDCAFCPVVSAYEKIQNSEAFVEAEEE